MLWLKQQNELGILSVVQSYSLQGLHDIEENQLILGDGSQNTCHVCCLEWSHQVTEKMVQKIPPQTCAAYPLIWSIHPIGGQKWKYFKLLEQGHFGDLSLG